jgi:hypothetical protein
MANKTTKDARERADAQFKQIQKGWRESDRAKAEYDAAAKAVDANTARLRSLRLANEAAKAKAAPTKKS